MNCRRGEIFYIKKSSFSDVGDAMETIKGRPYIVVSPDRILYNSDGALCVPLTTKTKRPMPQHCEIDCCGTRSTALCEKLKYVRDTQFGDYFCTLTDEEMAEVDKCLMAAVGVSPDKFSHSQSRTAEPLNKLLAEKDAKIKELQQEIETLKIRESAYLQIVKSL